MKNDQTLPFYISVPIRKGKVPVRTHVNRVEITAAAAAAAAAEATTTTVSPIIITQEKMQYCN